MPYLDATSIEVRALLRYCEKVSSPVAYKASCFIARGDWDSLVNMKVKPETYTSARRYLEDLQVVSLLKKHPDLKLTSDRRQAAVDNFFKAEALCYWTNERLNPLLYDSRHYGERMHVFLRAWRKEIRKVLGRVPTISQLDPKFGPGSTYNNVGDLITVADKLDSDYTATRQAWRLVSQPFDETAWQRYAACGLLPPEEWHRSEMFQFRMHAKHSENYNKLDYAVRDVQLVDANRFTTVPKTALTDRGICIEPGINVFYQLGLGAWLSRRLRYVYEWDKKVVQDQHRMLARLGSLTGATATIDLSMASDTVCRALVKLLLPPSWFDLLDQLRCKNTILDGRKIRLEKFSSMGNGYTFELETLLFYTLAQVITAQHADKVDWFRPGCQVSVFGDDIIVPVECVNDLVSALSFFGFSVNQDKSFWSGPFRESCGGDYYCGYDVRPHFQKVHIKEPHESIAFANGMHRVRSRLRIGDDSGDCVSPSIGVIHNAIPRAVRRCKGPKELGDLVIHDDDESHWQVSVRNSIRYVRVWRPVPNKRKPLDHYRPGVVYALALYLAGSGVSIGQTGTDEDAWRRSGVVPRLRGSYVSGYRFGRVPFS